MNAYGVEPCESGFFHLAECIFRPIHVVCVSIVYSPLLLISISWHVKFMAHQITH